MTRADRELHERYAKAMEENLDQQRLIVRAPVRHYPSPVRYVPDKIGCVGIEVAPRTGVLPIIGMRNAFLTGRRRASVNIVEPLTIHTLIDDRIGVWMTDLPEELQQVEDFLAGADVQGKRILVGGLGLGIVATRLVQLGAIVTVVEKSRSICRLIRRQLSDELETVHIVNADIFAYLRREAGAFDAYYLDIWRGTGEATWWTQVMPLRRIIGQQRGRSVVHCWAEDIMLGQVLQAIRMGGDHWHYGKLPKGTDPDAFVGPTMGTPAWERVYGVGLDISLKEVVT